MVPIVTGLLIIVAIAIIAMNGLGTGLKQELPIRQLTYEHFANPTTTTAPTTTAAPAPTTAPTTTTAPTVTGATTTTSLPAAANLSAINVTKEAMDRVDTVMGFINEAKLVEVLGQYTSTNMAPADFLNKAWRLFATAQSKYDKQYPKSTTTLVQVYVASLQVLIKELMKYPELKTSRVEPLILALRTWLPTSNSKPSSVAAAPYLKLASKPATVGVNNFGKNQFSLANITVPISTSNSLLKDLTGSSAIAKSNATTQALPANMAPSGPALALSGSETDAIITNLIKDTLKTELKNLGKADKVAITSESTPGLSQGTDFKGAKPKEKGQPANPNGTSDKCGYNHLGPLADYQDSFHPPLMPDGGYYDPRLYVRKDSIPCTGCNLDY